MGSALGQALVTGDFSPSDYVRWLSEEADPRQLLWPFPSEAMRMWPISTRVNKPENDYHRAWTQLSWQWMPPKSLVCCAVKARACARGTGVDFRCPPAMLDYRGSGLVVL